MTQMMCNTSFSAMKNKDHLELKRGFLSPLPSPELSSPDTLFHVLVPFHLSVQQLSFSLRIQCPLSEELPFYFSNQVDLSGTERLDPPGSLPNVLIPYEIVIFLQQDDQGSIT